MINRKRIVSPFGNLLAGLLLTALSVPAAITVQNTTYHGWNEAFMMSNGTVDVVIVPAIGRIMQFRFTGEQEGPFWENRPLDGKEPNPQSSDWINFGGDKTWPAPQSAWAKMTGRAWPPPQGFDSRPVECFVTNQDVVLRSRIDPHYGIQTERRISLAQTAAEMRVQTTYRKMQGEPVSVSIWVITQLEDPDRMYMPLPTPSIFPLGYNKQSDVLPPDLAVAGNLLSCTRSTKDSTKIGSDAGSLIWANAKYIVEIAAGREEEGEFPDNKSSAEIYTNPDPNQYIEFELLGPLHKLSLADTISRAQTYRLMRRGKASLDEQVKTLLKSGP